MSSSMASTTTQSSPETKPHTRDYVSLIPDSLTVATLNSLLHNFNLPLHGNKPDKMARLQLAYLGLPGSKFEDDVKVYFPMTLTSLQHCCRRLNVEDHGDKSELRRRLVLDWIEKNSRDGDSDVFAEGDEQSDTQAEQENGADKGDSMGGSNAVVVVEDEPDHTPGLRSRILKLFNVQSGIPMSAVHMADSQEKHQHQHLVEPVIVGGHGGQEDVEMFGTTEENIDQHNMRDSERAGKVDEMVEGDTNKNGDKNGDENGNIGEDEDGLNNRTNPRTTPSVQIESVAGDLTPSVQKQNTPITTTTTTNTPTLPLAELLSQPKTHKEEQQINRATAENIHNHLVALLLIICRSLNVEEMEMEMEVRVGGGVGGVGTRVQAHAHARAENNNSGDDGNINRQIRENYKRVVDLLIEADLLWARK